MDTHKKSPVYFCRREFDCDYQRTDTAQELSESHQASGERAERSWKEVPEKRRGFASEIRWRLQGHQEEVVAEENRVRGLVSFQTAVMTLFRVSRNEETEACLRVFSFSASFQSSCNHLSICLCEVIRQGPIRVLQSDSEFCCILMLTH